MLVNRLLEFEASQAELPAGVSFATAILTQLVQACIESMSAEPEDLLHLVVVTLHLRLQRSQRRQVAQRLDTHSYGSPMPRSSPSRPYETASMFVPSTPSPTSEAGSSPLSLAPRYNSPISTSPLAGAISGQNNLSYPARTRLSVAETWSLPTSTTAPTGKAHSSTGVPPARSPRHQGVLSCRVSGL